MIGMSGQSLASGRPAGDFGRGTSLHTASVYPLTGSLKTFPKQSSPELSIADSPNCTNVEVYRGELRSVPSPGVVLAGLPGATPSPNHITSFYGGNGIRYLLASTTTKIYRWNPLALSWTDISGAVTLNGALGRPPVSINAWGKWYYTNGVDYIYWWNEDNATITRLENADPTKNPPDACYFIYSFGDRLNCVSTKESGIWYPRRLRWSDFLAGTNFVDGSAGFKDMEESQYFPTGVSIFPDRAVIFRPDGATIQRRNLSTFYQFNSVKFPGPISPKSIVQIPQENMCIYLGKQGIYVTDGTSSKKVSQDILWETLLTDLGVNPDVLYLSEAFITPDEYRYVLLFYQTASGFLTAGIIWNFKENSWTKLNFADNAYRFTTTGSYGQVALDFSWDEADLTWDAADMLWQDSIGEVINETVALGRDDGTFRSWEAGSGELSPSADLLSWYSAPKPLPSRDGAIDHNEEQKLVFYGGGRFFARIGIGDEPEHITFSSDWQEILLSNLNGRVEIPIRKKARFHQVQIKGSVGIDSININRMEAKYMLAGEI